MKIRTVLLGAIAPGLLLPLANAASIDQATLTEVVNNVNIIEPASKKTSAAKVKQLFIAPNVMRTGPDSRAEMISPDQTVTRVGQSTLFSFEPNSREIELQRGSILFQSPSGKGGGNIRTSAASAAVLGTTLIVTTTKNGGFKVLLVEGKGRVKGADGSVRLLKSGQMVYALPGGKLSNAFEFRLSQQVSASRLVGGFKRNLPSVAKIEAAINKQEKEIAQGKAVATNLMASGSPNFAIQVDVARSTLIEESTVPEPVDPLTTATTTDAIVDAPTLDNTRLFGPGAGAGAVFSQEFGDDNVTPTRATNPAFFIGNNILFDTPTVDLTTFAMNDLFQFLAINNIDFAGSTDFGIFPDREVQLLAGRTFTAAPGTVVSGDGGQIGLIALGSTFPTDGTVPESLDDLALDVPFELADFGVTNAGGGIALLGGDMKFSGIQLDADTNLRVAAGRDLAIEGATPGAVLQALPSPYDNGALIVPTNFSTFNAKEQIRVTARRDIRVERTSFNSPKTVIDAGRGLKLTTVQLNDGSAERVFNPDAPVLVPPSSSDAKPSVYLFAQELADLRAVNFFANDVLIQSQTIRLENVNFRNNSYVILESRIGVLADNPNTNRPVEAGKVNFVRGVNYAGAPAQGRLEQNGPSSGSSSGNPGIYVRPFSGRPKN